MTVGAQTSGRWITYGVVGATLMGVLWFSLDQATGPAAEVTGIVQTAGATPSGDLGPSAKLATVRLADGTLVQASVATATTPKPGQVAKLQVYRRLLSGAHTYQVVGVESQK